MEIRYWRKPCLKTVDQCLFNITLLRGRPFLQALGRQTKGKGRPFLLVLGCQKKGNGRPFLQPLGCQRGKYVHFYNH